MNHLVLGYMGEVGSAIFRILKEGNLKVHGKDFESETWTCSHEVEEFSTDLMMHVCLPWSKNFYDELYDYHVMFKPKIVVIHSTVEPGTTLSCLEDDIHAIYSPVRGRHPNMYEDIKKYTKWVAGWHEPTTNKVAEVFERCGLKTRIHEDPTTIEFAKLYETAYIGWKIAFFQMMKRNAIDENFGYEATCNFLEETAPVYRRAGIIDNEGSGKHCIMNNLELLDDGIASVIQESNEKRKLELLD